MAIDLGKQYGPLPLGAWIVVVGVGLGIAYYTRNAGTDEPIDVEDGSSPDGVGDGSVGGWVPTSPPSSGDVAQVDLSTNDSWGRAAINFLVAEGYNATASDQAIRKYLAGTKLSVQETALVGRALMKYGAPPTPLPPVEDDGTTTPPPPSTGGGTTVPSVSAPFLHHVITGRTDATLSWNLSPGAASYIVYQSGGGQSSRAIAQGVKALTYRATGLKPDSIYYFSVAAVNSAGRRSASTSQVVKVRTKR